MNRKILMQSNRMLFSIWNNDDLLLAKELWGNKDVTRYISANGVFSQKQIEDRLNLEINNMNIFNVQYWPIFLKNGSFVGCCGLKPHGFSEYELGFHLLPKYWHLGYGYEAARTVIEYAFCELKCKRMIAGHNPNNLASKNLLLKLGFTYISDEFYEPTGLMHPTYELKWFVGFLI